MAELAPNFCTLSMDAIRLALVADFEASTDKALDPASPEALLISRFAYREWILRQQMQAAVEQMLVPFAGEAALEHHARARDTERLPATSASATFAWTLAVGHPGVTIPAGTRVAADDSAATFVALEPIVVGAGVTLATATLEAESPGTIGNGYAAGRVSQLLDPRPFVVGVLNTATTAGGAEEEGLEAWRARVMTAWGRLSGAGPAGAYRSLALAAHPDLVDVAITNPTPGTVRVVPLAATGAPSTPVLDAVEAALSADEVVPLCDTVEVVAPTAVGYAITASLTFLATADTTAGMAEAQARGEALAADLSKRLGRNVVPSAIVAALSVAGVYQVTVTAPSSVVTVGPEQWANCSGVTLTLTGVVDG